MHVAEQVAEHVFPRPAPRLPITSRHLLAVAWMLWRKQWLGWMVLVASKVQLGVSKIQLVAVVVLPAVEDEV